MCEVTGHCYVFFGAQDSPLFAQGSYLALKISSDEAEKGCSSRNEPRCAWIAENKYEQTDFTSPMLSSSCKHEDSDEAILMGKVFRNLPTDVVVGSGPRYPVLSVQT